jgi:hypothetical protein
MLPPLGPISELSRISVERGEAGEIIESETAKKQVRNTLPLYLFIYNI